MDQNSSYSQYSVVSGITHNMIKGQRLCCTPSTVEFHIIWLVSIRSQSQSHDSSIFDPILHLYALENDIKSIVQNALHITFITLVHDPASCGKDKKMNFRALYLTPILEDGWSDRLYI